MKIQIKEAAKAKKDWSIYKLAQAMEIPQQTVWSWATGRTQPSYESIDFLCTVLGCTLNDLFSPEPRSEWTPKTRLMKQRAAALAAIKAYKKMEFEMDDED